MIAAARARLVYDSDRAAARVGRRSAGGFDRTLLFRSHRLVVDVVVHRGADELHLVQGQILDERSGAPVVDAHVSLADDDLVVTDEFGQFSLSAMSGEARHMLRVQASGHELHCPIPLEDLDG